MTERRVMAMAQLRIQEKMHESDQAKLIALGALVLDAVDVPQHLDYVADNGAFRVPAARGTPRGAGSPTRVAQDSPLDLRAWGEYGHLLSSSAPVVTQMTPIRHPSSASLQRIEALGRASWLS